MPPDSKRMPEGTRKKVARKSAANAHRETAVADKGTDAQGQAGHQKLQSPIVPLLWLLIPFVGVIVYAYLTGE